MLKLGHTDFSRMQRMQSSRNFSFVTRGSSKGVVRIDPNATFVEKTMNLI